MKKEIGKTAYGRMPKCLRYAGLIPAEWPYGEERGYLVQRFLLDVWTEEYRAYHGEIDLDFKEQDEGRAYA